MNAVAVIALISQFDRVKRGMSAFYRAHSHTALRRPHWNRLFWRGMSAIWLRYEDVMSAIWARYERDFNFSLALFFHYAIELYIVESTDILGIGMYRIIWLWELVERRPIVVHASQVGQRSTNESEKWSVESGECRMKVNGGVENGEMRAKFGESNAEWRDWMEILPEKTKTVWSVES